MPTWPTGLSIRREGFGKGKRRLISKLNAVLHTVNRFLLNSNSRDCRIASIFPLVCIVPTIYFHHFISLSIPFLRSDCPSMFRVYSSPFFLLPRLPPSLSTSYLSIYLFLLTGCEVPSTALLEARALFRDIRVFRVPWLRETKGQQWAQTRSQPYLLLCYNFLPAFLSSFFASFLPRSLVLYH